MFAKSSKVGLFFKKVCIALKYCSCSKFETRKLVIVNFHSAFSFHGAFILFMALYFSCIAPFCSCIALYSNFLSVSQHLCIFSNCESARYFTFFQIVMQLLFQFLDVKRLIS
jgi:hypothetical protein